MGLDGVELVMEVEATFSVVIDDRDAEKLLKVGDLHRYVLERLGAELPDEPGCLSAVVFNRLRRALGQALDVDRKRVRPEVAVESLVPADSRPDAWRRLGAALGLALPQLERPEWVYAVVVPAWGLGTVSTVGLVVNLFLYRENQLVTSTEFTTFAVAGFGLAIAVELATRPLERRLPRGCETVRGLVEAVLARNFAHLRAERRRWNPDDVWTTLRRLVAEQAGVDPETVHESTAFSSLW